MINKVVGNVNEACRGIESGMTIMLGGFGLCGIPENCIHELVKMKINNLISQGLQGGINLDILQQLNQMKAKKKTGAIVALEQSAA